MADQAEHPDTLEQAFLREDRKDIIDNVKLGCVVGILLMPAGAILDWIVYGDPSLKWFENFLQGTCREFLLLRIMCSLLISLFYLVVRGPLGKKHPRPLGILLAMFPTFFISLMIYRQDGSASLYYAGLNLVLLVIGFVLYWTLLESAIAVSLVLLMYVVACWLHGPIEWQVFGNNLYFLILTGIIVMAGSSRHSSWRFDLFARRFELDQKKRQLETSNEQLNQKKGELELSNTQLSRTKAELEVSNRGLSSQKRQVEETLEKLRLTQDELVTKEKQASLGVWSAGIIHEINNPLNYVRTGLYALRNVERYLPASEQAEFKEVYHDIDDGVRRVHDIVTDLRKFAHPGLDQPSLVAIEDVLRMVLRFCSEDLRGRIEVVPKVPPGFAVYAERNKLIQVLTNLVQNSIHALGDKQFTTSHPVITIEGREEAGRRLVIVRDNGPGIAKENLEKVFDPFFTTKAPGQGMGLGLGICYRIIQGFGGTIRVKSEPGEFCEFTLDLPADVPEANEA